MLVGRLPGGVVAQAQAQNQAAQQAQQGGGGGEAQGGIEHNGGVAAIAR